MDDILMEDLEMAKIVRRESREQWKILQEKINESVASGGDWHTIRPLYLSLIDIDTDINYVRFYNTYFDLLIKGEHHGDN
jgi:hypothetical protein